MVGLEELQTALRDISDRSKARTTLTGESESQGAWNAMLAQAGVDLEEMDEVVAWIGEQGAPALAILASAAQQLSGLMSTAFAAGLVTGRAAQDRVTEEPQL